MPRTIPQRSERANKEVLAGGTSVGSTYEEYELEQSICRADQGDETDRRTGIAQIDRSTGHDLLCRRTAGAGVVSNRARPPGDRCRAVAPGPTGFAVWRDRGCPGITGLDRRPFFVSHLSTPAIEC